MISEASAQTIKDMIEVQLKGAELSGFVDDQKLAERLVEARTEIEEILALYAEAENADPDMLSDGQKLDAALEAIYRVLPQYRPVKCEVGTEERGDVGVSVLRMLLEWEMT